MRVPQKDRTQPKGKNCYTTSSRARATKKGAGNRFFQDALLELEGDVVREDGDDVVRRDEAGCL